MSFEFEVGVAKVQGVEACKFLQAIVSSDVAVLDVSSSQPSLLLTPEGKVVSAFWIYRSSEDTYLLAMETEILYKTLQNLNRFLIRTEATIEDVSSKYIASLTLPSELVPTSALVVEQNHLGADGFVLVLEENLEAKTEEGKAKEIYQNLRISFGVVSCSRDLVDEIIPQEAELDKNAVSFTKGCYLGQELVCRIDSREATTPFSFFTAKEELPLPEGVVVTSKLQRAFGFDEKVPSGQFEWIIRVPRKLAAEIEELGAIRTSGYFSI